MEVSGQCDERFAGLRAAFEATFVPKESIYDVGASVAVTVDGQLVADLWGGTIEGDDGVAAPWQSDTIINVWSTTKTVAALACLMLADRGEIDLYGPVAKVWPEFAAEGKDRVEVRHVLSHTAGLSGWEHPITAEDLYDSEYVAGLLAAQAPWWEPGTASGYHGLTQGFLEAEIVRRVTGQSIGTFVAEQIAAPLGADFHIGTPPSCDTRVARVIPPAAPADDVLALLDPNSVAAKSFANPQLDPQTSWSLPWRRAEIPAAGGHGNARSVATIHAPMACGGESGGVRLLSSPTIDAVFDEQCHGTDLVLGMPLRHGIGFGLPLPELPIGPNPRTCFWGGWGGSLAVIDLDARMTFAYVMNKMGEGTVGDFRAATLLMTVYAGLAAS